MDLINYLKELVIQYQADLDRSFQNICLMQKDYCNSRKLNESLNMLTTLFSGVHSPSVLGRDWDVLPIDIP